MKGIWGITREKFGARPVMYAVVTTASIALILLGSLHFGKVNPFASHHPVMGGLLMTGGAVFLLSMILCCLKCSTKNYELSPEQEDDNLVGQLVLTEAQLDSYFHTMAPNSFVRYLTKQNEERLMVKYGENEPKYCDRSRPEFTQIPKDQNLTQYVILKNGTFGPVPKRQVVANVSSTSTIKHLEPTMDQMREWDLAKANILPDKGYVVVKFSESKRCLFVEKQLPTAAYNDYVHEGTNEYNKIIKDPNYVRYVVDMNDEFVPLNSLQQT